MNKRDFKEKASNSKGITLVALIITIIVLLVLATVSISLVMNNGIIDKTEKAVQSNKDSQEEEKIKLAVAAAQLAGNGTLTIKNLNIQLKSDFNND